MEGRIGVKDVGKSSFQRGVPEGLKPSPLKWANSQGVYLAESCYCLFANFGIKAYTAIH